MTEESKEKKIQEYQERYRFWADKRISQLSFHNDFLLTLAIAVIGYLWSERSNVYMKLRIDFNGEIDWTVVFFLLGLIAVALSICSGLFMSLSRLYDLRVTSNVLLARKRSTENGTELNDDEFSQFCFSRAMKNLLCVLWRYQNYEVTTRDISDSNGFQSKFTKLRQMSRDFGDLTWCLLRWQTAFLFVGVVLSMFVLALK